MRRTPVPARVALATELAAVRGPEHVLDIGCGTGVALDEVAQALTTGHVTGMDRSSTAIARAARRNAEHLAAGRASLIHSDLADLAMPAASVHTALAINVNLFWTTPADRELDVITDVLRPDGVLHLVFESPTATPRDFAAVEANLRRHRFTTTPAVARGELVAFTARPER